MDVPSHAAMSISCYIMLAQNINISSVVTAGCEGEGVECEGEGWM